MRRLLIVLVLYRLNVIEPGHHSCGGTIFHDERTSFLRCIVINDDKRAMRAQRSQNRNCLGCTLWHIDGNDAALGAH